MNTITIFVFAFLFFSSSSQCHLSIRLFCVQISNSYALINATCKSTPYIPLTFVSGTYGVHLHVALE